MISIKTLMDASDIEDYVVLAGKNGLEREIKTVTVLDAPDAPSWLSGGEFVLTSAFIFSDSEQLFLNYIRGLVEKGAVGLGVKLNRFINEIPKSVTQYADQTDFTILAIPYHLVWSDIINRFHEIRLILQPEDNLYRIDPTFLGQVLEASKWGSKYFVRKLSELLNMPTAIADDNRNIVFESEDNGVISQFLKTDLRCLSEVSIRSSVKFKDCQILIRPFNMFSHNKDEFIILACFRETLPNQTIALLEILSKFPRNDVLMKRNKNQLYSDFINNIISSNLSYQQIRDIAFDLGIMTNAQFCMLIIEGNRLEDTYNELMMELKQKTEFQNFNSYFITNAEKKELVVLLMISVPALKQSIVQNSIRKSINALNKEHLSARETTVFVGRVHFFVEKIKDSYLEARDTYSRGVILWPDRRTFFYEDIVIIKLLGDLVPMELTFDEINFLNYKAKQFNFDSISTLEIYLDHLNYKKAASIMFIHENTMRYRVQKIVEALDIDIENPVIRLNMLLKIKLWKMMR